MKKFVHIAVLLFTCTFFAGPTILKNKVKLRGEIVDPKCAMGIMSPGVEKSHKTCAIECIQIGLPALFKVKTSPTTYRYYLLTQKMRKPVKDLVLPYIGDPVEIEGVVIKDANMLMLMIESIQRVPE